jgi:hypothetical protein
LITILDGFRIINYDEQATTFIVTDFGLLLKSILLKNENLFFELYHLISYYAFELNDENYEYLPFKSYQLFCNNIYETKAKPDGKKLADEIESTISQTYNVEGAFSDVCINRATAWERS